MKIIKAAAVQLSPVLYSREATVEKIVRKIHELGQQGVQFATFPETVVPYYPYFSAVQTPLPNSKEKVMRRIVFALVGVGMLAGAVATIAPVSGQSDGEAAPIYGIKLPQGYRDWHLISVKQLTGKQLTGGGGDLKQLRAELGNDIAIKAFRDGTLPFPDGAIIAALHWNEDSSASDNQALAAGFPGAGLESSFAGSAVNVQFMVKDSKKYAASGGWGFADFTNGKPGNEALHAKCFPCHQPAKDRDYVFTRYAPTP